MIIKSIEKNRSKNDKMVRIMDRFVGSQTTGLVIDSIELNSKDLRDLSEMEPEKLHAYICMLSSRMRMVECHGR